MQTLEIQRRFLEYFQRNGHTVVPSASLISQDPTVLFTIAGMAPFKPYFLGQQTPPWPRATSVQKVLRTLDIENVGQTTRHCTFFQMAGNFSFGDYFKAGAITHAWTLITSTVEDGGLGFDPERIWVTVYKNDDEAIRAVGGDRRRCLPSGSSAAAARTTTGTWACPAPAAPARRSTTTAGPEFGRPGGPVEDEDRYIEIWNLVFMQDIRGEDSPKYDFPPVGSLPAEEHRHRHGRRAGRVPAAGRGQRLRDRSDASLHLHRRGAQSGRTYGADGENGATDDVRFRVIADHVRSAALVIADGITPSNEGRGYVLRRLIRRVIRSIRLLGVTEPVMATLMTQVRDLLGPIYTDLADGLRAHPACRRGRGGQLPQDARVRLQAVHRRRCGEHRGR